MYFSTKVWRFKMECSACKGEIVIETEPAYKTYTYASGLRRQPERSESSEPIMSNTTAPSQTQGGINNAPAPAPVLNQRLLTLTREVPKHVDHRSLPGPSKAELEALHGMKHDDNIDAAHSALAMASSMKHQTKTSIPPKIQAEELIVANAVVAAQRVASINQTEQLHKAADTPAVPVDPIVPTVPTVPTVRAESVIVDKMERVTRAKRRKLDAQNQFE